MKNTGLWLTILLLFYTVAGCQKKMCPAEEVALPLVEPVTALDSNRNDVPSPLHIPWREVDTSQFSDCEKRIWQYTRNMYPVDDSNFWNYPVYSVFGEPEDILQRREWEESYIYFFLDTIQKFVSADASLPCAGMDTSYFKQTIGLPTCETQNPARDERTYLYAFKMNHRRGPCPYIAEPGSPFDSRCFALHFEYCSNLKIIFSHGGAETSSILFFGGG